MAWYQFRTLVIRSPTCQFVLATIDVAPRLLTHGNKPYENDKARPTLKMPLASWNFDTFLNLGSVENRIDHIYIGLI